MDYPKLRALEVLPVPNHRAICLRDPHGFCEEPVFVSDSSIVFLRFFDGNHSIRDIQTAILRATGTLVMSDQIEGLVRKLDDLHLLDSDNFRKRKEEIVNRFRSDTIRRPSHAGLSYPSDAGELRDQITSFFTDVDGPGLPVETRPWRTSAVIAPHIDLRNGGPCYAHAYRKLLEGTDADTFVILGVAHSGAENPFAATRKDFESPLGASPVDHEFLDSLCGQLSFDIMEDEVAHRNEHSIEFQIVFLQQFLGSRHKIVPLLIGSFHEMLAKDRRPEDDERIGSFFAAMRTTLEEFGRRVAVIVSVDLAHVGPRFGDSEPLSSRFLSGVEQEDLAFLQAAEMLNADAVLESIRKDNDARRVDGFPGIYTLLSVMPLREGKLLKYSQTVDYQAQSAVSFASLAFE